MKRSLFISRNNWLKVQRHEKEYFTSGKNKQWRTPHSLQYWLNFLQITQLQGTGLEIGCGSNGIYNFTENVIGLDSINYKKKNFIIGVAEYLPFTHTDFIICCNSLDHCQDPQLVIQEMLQITNKIILWSNTFPRIIKQLMKVFDKTHPYHFSENELKKLFKNTICTKQVTKSLLLWHGKHATLKAKFKLFIGSLFGIKGICLHLEVKY